MLKAILIDVGGPLVDEDEFYQRTDELILELLAREGKAVAEEEYHRILRDYTARCYPAPRGAALWHLLRPDLKLFQKGREMIVKEIERWRASKTRPGAVEAVAALAKRYTLALAGNQRARVKELLRREGLLEHFQFQLVSEELGVSKPDPLFFQMILDSLGVKPQEAAMVGDRLDIDIYPAKLLGLRTVRVLVGPYAAQEPPTPFHEPDITIRTIAELPEILDHDPFG